MNTNRINTTTTIETFKHLPGVLRRPVSSSEKIIQRSIPSVKQERKFLGLADLKSIPVSVAWSTAEPFNPRTIADLSPTLDQIVFSHTTKGDELRASAQPTIDKILAHPLIQSYVEEISKPVQVGTMETEEFRNYLKSVGASEDEIQNSVKGFELSTAVNIIIKGIPHVIFQASKFISSTNNKLGTAANEFKEIYLKDALGKVMGSKEAAIIVGSVAVQEFTWAVDQKVYPELFNRAAAINSNFSSMTQEQQFAQIKAYAQTMPPDELATLINKEIFATRKLTGENYTKFGKNRVLDPQYVSNASDPNIFLDLLQKELFRAFGVKFKVRLTKDFSIPSDTEPPGPFTSGLEVTSDLGEGQTAGSVIIGGNENPVLGTIGNDTITAGVGTEIINGLKGDDNIIGISGTKTIFGGQGQDNITGDGQEVFGNRGSDTLNGGVGPDILHGGQGDDVLDGKGGPDKLFGDSGKDGAVYNKGYDPLTLHDDIEAILIDRNEFNLNSASRGASPLGTAYDGVYLDGTHIANIPMGSPITITTVGTNAKSIKL